MALKRTFAALIWGATVIVAAQFLPSIAQAHAGHDHASYSVVAATGGATASSDQAIDSTELAEKKREVTPTEFTSVDSNTIPAGSSGGCNGSCCGTGSACCGAILQFLSVSLPDVRAGRQPVGSGSSAPPGINPDALRKPPKSLA